MKKKISSSFPLADAVLVLSQTEMDANPPIAAQQNPGY